MLWPRGSILLKPVNLNQLLFHTTADCLSFFQSPLSSKVDSDDFEKFFEEMLSQLVIQDKKNLSKILDKNRAQVRKILKSNQDKSLGFFISENLQGYITVQNKIEPYCMIGKTFHVRPLLEELFVNPEFLLVNVSLYDIKIYRGDFQHIEIIQQYEFDQLPKNFNFQASRLYAPQYLGLIPYKTILAIRTIAQKIKDMTLYESLPIVVTGLDEMKSIFLKFFGERSGMITHFQEDLFEKTCIEIQDKCKKFRFAITDYYSYQLKERLKRMMKSNLILTDVGEIIKATLEGKIAHLVIPSEKKLWGSINLETGEYSLHKKSTKTSVDILNELAEEVIRQGGKIQILVPHFFPTNSSVFGVLRGGL